MSTPAASSPKQTLQKGGRGAKQSTERIHPIQQPSLAVSSQPQPGSATLRPHRDTGRPQQRSRLQNPILTAIFFSKWFQAQRSWVAFGQESAKPFSHFFSQSFIWQFTWAVRVAGVQVIETDRYKSIILPPIPVSIGRQHHSKCDAMHKSMKPYDDLIGRYVVTVPLHNWFTRRRNHREGQSAT